MTTKSRPPATAAPRRTAMDTARRRTLMDAASGLLGYAGQLTTKPSKEGGRP